MSELNNNAISVVEGTHDELLAVENDGGANMAGFQNPAFECYCSIPKDNKRENMVARYNALAGCDHKLDEFLDKPLEIVDIAAHPVTFKDKESGKETKSIRTILIDKDGLRYQAVSGGVAQSLQRIMAIFGAPHWDEPITMIPHEEKTRNGFKVMTISLA